MRSRRLAHVLMVTALALGIGAGARDFFGDWVAATDLPPLEVPVGVEVLARDGSLLHVVQDSLPFGGVGASGMGQYHGHHGFLTFSKLKPVLYQARLNAMPLLRPPYGRLLRWLQTWMIR